MPRSRRTYGRTPRKPTDPGEAAVARIAEITSTAKGIWFGLLSYLAFVGVTWMGVEHPDFFLPQRQTQLPLIGVSVPTRLFFAVGPALGALIYAYFHMQLLKLWEALATAPPRVGGVRLSERIKPWLVSDLCLSYRTDGALRPRPLARTSHFVNFVFVFLGTPLVLGAVWWTSAVPHDDLLTMVACGVPLSFSIFVGLSSWLRMKRLAKAGTTDVPGRGWPFRGVVAVLTLVVLVVGFFRVEGTFTHYARSLGMTEEEIAGTWLDWEVLDFLEVAQLSGVNFDGTPPDWPDRQTYRIEHREAWCKREGLPALVCGPAPDLDDPDKARGSILRARTYWCTNRKMDAAACTETFAEYETAFEASWQRQRRLDSAKYPVFDMTGFDLRGANLFQVRLERANLREARLNGASLREARLEGTNLRTAWLNGADLNRARLEGSNLLQARLEGADLRLARLNGAELIQARLEGTNLRLARLDGVTAIRASLKGAYLGKVVIDENTIITGSLRGAALRAVNPTTLTKLKPFWNDVFADGTVTVPKEKRPTHWADEPLDYRPWDIPNSPFHQAWYEWQRSIGMDPERPGG